MVDESSPILGSGAGAGETVLVLSPHAKFGRQVSVLCSCAFMVLFHGFLLWVAMTNATLPCDGANLASFLTAIGLVGIASALLYGLIEMKRSADEALMPGEAATGVSANMKTVAGLLVLASVATATVGFVLFAKVSPSCATTSPVLYNWTTAVLLLYGVFGGLVALVPILSASFPLLSLALVPLLGALYSFAQWTSEAGKRGATSAVRLLAQWLGGGGAAGSDVESGVGGVNPLVNPAPTLASYINTAALVWLFGYMLVEVRREYGMACDAPLPAYVMGVAALGSLLSVADFVGGVFKDPMPLVTKLEQEQAKEERKRKLAALGWLAGGVLLWGALGLYWLGESSTCQATSPGVYRLALLLGLGYAAVLAILALVVVALAVDYCLSGKVRMVLILEQ